MKKKEPEKMELSQSEFEDLRNEIFKSNISKEKQELIVKTLQGMIWLSQMLKAKKLSIRKILRLFGFKTEKRKPNDGNKGAPKGKEGGGSKGQRGCGRNGQKDYPGAKKIFYPHETLKKGDRCPSCARGNLHGMDPGVFIHFKGAPPILAEIHYSEKLRCSTCGEISTANVPKEVRKQKYDETVDVSIVLMKYGLGTPFNRLSWWQKILGIPIPASTQWERCEHLASSVYKVFEELKKVAANGSGVGIDDTTNRIILLKKELCENNSKRKGIYTTGIVADTKFGKIKLFFTGNKHAGENLDNILKYRDGALGPIMKMSDAMSNNNLKENMAIKCLCLAHGRRNFVDAETEYEWAANHVLILLGNIYCFDAKAKDKDFSNEDRLNYHQKKSGPIMKKLRRWCLKMLHRKKVDPADSLGQAIQYLLNNWEGLTEFLRTPGAKLDNNEVERHLKRAILHRKNSWFFRSVLGAYVGDVMMSIIETCKSLGSNPFAYLMALHKNRSKVHSAPHKWLPWNLKVNLVE